MRRSYFQRWVATWASRNSVLLGHYSHTIYLIPIPSATVEAIDSHRVSAMGHHGEELGTDVARGGKI